MKTCSICGIYIRNGIILYKETIGFPPIAIGDIFLKCTNGIKFDVDSRICPKCTEKLMQYNKALSRARSIKEDILNSIKFSVQNNESIFERAAQSFNFVDVKEGEGEEEESELRDYNHDNDDDDDEVEQRNGKTEEALELLNSSTEFSDGKLEQLQIEPLNESTEEENLNFNDMTIYADYISPPSKKKKGKKEKQTFKCRECKKEFIGKRLYRAHMRKEHFSGYVCDQCGKTLLSYSGFTAHYIKHSMKKLECTHPGCEQKFYYKHELNQHLAYHSGEKPFECDICHKRCVTRVSLHKHKKIHDEGAKCLKCELCGFRFRSKSHLKRHMSKHTGAKPYNCSICGKSFSQRYNLRVHEKEHESPGSTRQRRLKCPNCPRTFTNKQNYEEHCKENHDNDQMIELHLQI